MKYGFAYISDGFESIVKLSQAKGMIVWGDGSTLVRRRFHDAEMANVRGSAIILERVVTDLFPFANMSRHIHIHRDSSILIETLLYNQTQD